jgi:hypothetical protein
MVVVMSPRQIREAFVRSLAAEFAGATTDPLDTDVFDDLHAIAAEMVREQLIRTERVAEVYRS